MKSVLARLKSVYLGAQISVSGNDIDVYADGEHLLAVRDGRDQSKALGCSDEFSLEPIPKACRLFEEVDGKIVKVKKFAERLAARKEFLDERGIVQSIVALKAKGYSFDDAGECTGRPKREAPIAQQEA